MSDILLIQLRKLGDDLSVERFTVRRTTLAAADEITELREQLATVTVERDEYKVALTTLQRWLSPKHVTELTLIEQALAKYPCEDEIEQARRMV